jgi:phosphoadenosine phosphosulfate reductase
MEPTCQNAFPELDEEFLSHRIDEGIDVIKNVLKSTDKPLVIQFSGGKDSMAMLGLVREVTKNYVCSYMQTDIDFKESVEFAKQSAMALGTELLISTPAEHFGGFFERLAKFRKFPTVRETWCNRDLKVRPQQKMLNRILGKGNVVKLIGVRRSESTRRMSLYKWGEFTRPDNQVGGADNVYPILHWTDADVRGYLKLKGLPTSGLYKKYGVSGCYWCPFYQPSIYMAILRDRPNLYDKIIEWEEEIGPSVGNFIYLRDLKSELKV